MSCLAASELCSQWSWGQRAFDLLRGESTRRAGRAQWLSAGFVIERSRVRALVGAAGELSSLGSASCADPYFSIRFTHVLPQKHVKYLGHSAKSAGGRLQLNMHEPYVCRRDTIN